VQVTVTEAILDHVSLLCSDYVHQPWGERQAKQRLVGNLPFTCYLLNTGEQ
jgi:hypothetical protein